MAETKTKTPVLSLDTLVERKFILIDGERHELTNAAELSILDYHRVARQGERVQAMMEQDSDLTDAQVLELSALLDSLCKVVLRAPAEVHAKLTDQHKLAVIGTFTSLQREEMAQPAGATAPTPSTGESSSPA